MTKRVLNGDGWRARIGIVVPSVNTVMCPDQISKTVWWKDL